MIKDKIAEIAGDSMASTIQPSENTNKMRLSDKIKKLKDGMRLHQYKCKTSDKEVSEAEQDGRVVARFVKKDGQVIETSGSEDAQDSGAFKEAAEAAGVKEKDLTYTSIHTVAEQLNEGHQIADGAQEIGSMGDKQVDTPSCPEETEDQNLFNGDSKEVKQKEKVSQGKPDKSLTTMSKLKTGEKMEKAHQDVSLSHGGLTYHKPESPKPLQSPKALDYKAMPPPAPKEPVWKRNFTAKKIEQHKSAPNYKVTEEKSGTFVKSEYGFLSPLRKMMACCKSQYSKLQKDDEGYKALKERLKKPNRLRPGSSDEKIRAALASQEGSNPYASPGPRGGGRGFGGEIPVHEKFKAAADKQAEENPRAKMQANLSRLREHASNLKEQTPVDHKRKFDMFRRLSNNAKKATKKKKDIENQERSDAVYSHAYGPDITHHKNEAQTRESIHTEHIPGSNSQIHYHGSDEKGNHYFSTHGQRSHYFVANKDETGKTQITHLPNQYNLRSQLGREGMPWTHLDTKKEAKYLQSSNESYGNKGAKAGIANIKRSSKFKELTGRKSPGNYIGHPRDFGMPILHRDDIYGKKNRPDAGVYKVSVRRKYGEGENVHRFHKDKSSGKWTPNYKPHNPEESRHIFQNIVRPKLEANAKGQKHEYQDWKEPESLHGRMSEKGLRIVKSLAKSMRKNALTGYPQFQQPTLGKAEVRPQASPPKAESQTASGSPKIRSVADQYAATKGIKLNHTNASAEVNTDRAKKIAQAYEAMPHTPNEPNTQKAYGALINETLDQFGHIKNSGLKISKMKPDMENPYKKGSKDVFRDINENNHLWYYPTESGFGQGETKEHPMLQPTKEHLEGKPLLANDVFRIVHDYFGHAKEGNGFGTKGEETAWQTHMPMYSPEAQKALTSETRGQNSWVNFGPHAEHNRKNPHDTRYAEQKAGLLPDWAMEKE